MARGLFAWESKKSVSKAAKQWEVLRREEGAVIVRKDGAENSLPLDQAGKFSVFGRQNIRCRRTRRLPFELR